MFNIFITFHNKSSVSIAADLYKVSHEVAQTESKIGLTFTHHWGREHFDLFCVNNSPWFLDIHGDTFVQQVYIKTDSNEVTLNDENYADFAQKIFDFCSAYIMKK